MILGTGTADDGQMQYCPDQVEAMPACNGFNLVVGAVFDDFLTNA